MPGGCQAFNQVGRTSLECPDMGTIAGNFRGCCRPDNTCGYNFSSVVDGDGLFKGAGTLPLGCVPQYVTTAPPDGDAGGLPRPRLPSDPCTWVPDEVDGG
jgi:hypothetical protein